MLGSLRSRELKAPAVLKPHPRSCCVTRWGQPSAAPADETLFGLMVFTPMEKNLWPHESTSQSVPPCTSRRHLPRVHAVSSDPTGETQQSASVTAAMKRIGWKRRNLAATIMAVEFS